MENSTKAPQDIKNTITILYTSPLSGTWPKELKSSSPRDICTHIHYSIIYDNQEVEVSVHHEMNG